MSASKFCQYCGTAIDEGNKFCQKCGKPTAAPAPVMRSATVVEPSSGFSTPPPSTTSRPSTTSHPVQQPVSATSMGEPVATSIAPAAAASLDDYTLLKKIYNQAAQVEPVQRDAFLQQACEGNSNLLGQLRSMFVTESASYTGGAQQATMPPQQVPHSVSAAASTPQAYFIGAYRLLREIGRGGMGVVYLAVRDDNTFRKNVALKLLLRDQVNAEFITRFKQERQVIAALDHPNIARILDGGDTADGMPYYVMEYVEGLPLDRYCDQQRLSLTARIKLFQQVCLAVNYLHQNLILHRDLKPSNILVSGDGVVKLLDFGIAKVVGAGAWANADLTTAAGRPMTPTYASPEQISGATLTKTSDLYSLGAILYGLLTGRPAYVDLDDKLAKIAARETPPAPSTNIREDLKSAETTQQFRRAMMGELDSIVIMAMQIDPKDRYQSAADLAQDLQRFLDGTPVTAHHSSAAVRGVKLLRRKRVAVAVVCAFIVLVAFGLWGWQHLERQKSDAAATNARLSALIVQLQDRLQKNTANSDASAAPIDEDVRKLKDAFQKDYSNTGPDHEKVLNQGIHYLDEVHAAAPSNPKINEEVGDAYQQLGTLQEKTAKGDAKHQALQTYQKAATSLARVSGNEGSKARLASVNERIKALGGKTVEASAEPPPVQTPVVTEATPVETVTKVTPMKQTVATPRVAPEVTPPPPPPAPEKQAVSEETQEQLANVSSKVQITDQTIDPVRQNLERSGQTLNADTLARIGRMHASLERAKRAVANGNEADAKESLAAADALATKLLASVGR